MKKEIKRYIEEHKLIEKGEHIIIGVSGGADSMCLLHMLKSVQEEYKLKLTVAHIHHGVRIEADEDAKYVEYICKEWEIPYKEHRCNIKELAKANKCSEEEVGRNERYTFFRRLLSECDADKIAVAHTMNDQAETLLMRLIRGSGITGLGGIMPKRNDIIRPLLGITREEVEEYCLSNGVGFKDDITNKMDIYTRNKLRLQVLPMLKRDYNPRIVQSLSQTALQLQETESYLEEQTKVAYEKIVAKVKDEYKIKIESLLSYHHVIQTRIIREVISNNMGTLKNIHYQNIKDILGLVNKQSGKCIYIDDTTFVIREHDYMKFAKHKINISYSHNLEVGTQVIDECNKVVRIEIEGIDKNVQRIENAYTKNIDYDKINGNLQIRNRRPGDKILLKNGVKKLKDFFIDEKVPRTYRDSVILITDDVNVIWVVGYRLSEGYYITEATRKILNIQICDVLVDN